MTPTKKTPAKATEDKPTSAKATAGAAGTKKAAAPRAAAAKKAAAPKPSSAGSKKVVAEKAPAVVEAPAAVEAPVAAKAVVAVAEAPASEAAMAPAKHIPKGTYIYALGRRKTAIAQTRLFTGGKGDIQVNGKPYTTYFTVYDLQEAVTAPLKAIGMADADVQLKVKGGGMRGQAEAARLGISRALIELNPAYRKTLKKMGFLMRDPREKERKKYGLKKARKAPQWAKR